MRIRLHRYAKRYKDTVQNPYHKVGQKGRTLHHKVGHNPYLIHKRGISTEPYLIRKRGISTEPYHKVEPYRIQKEVGHLTVPYTVYRNAQEGL